MKRYLKLLVVLTVVFPVAVLAAACGAKAQPLEGVYDLERVTIKGQTFTAADYKKVETDDGDTYELINNDKIDKIFDSLTDGEKTALYDAVNNAVSGSPDNNLYSDIISTLTGDTSETYVKACLIFNVKIFANILNASDLLGEGGHIMQIDLTDDGGYTLTTFMTNGTVDITVNGNLITEVTDDQEPQELSWNKSNGTLTAADTLISKDDVNGVAVSLTFIRSGDVPQVIIF